MSIESKEIKDIHALYQNLYEETARERMQKNIERIKNPFGNTTIETRDGKELKQGDDGFDDALANARKTMRDANNKSLNAADRKANEKSGLGSGSSSSSSSSSSSNTKKRIPGESSLSKKEFDAKYDSDDKVVKALDDDEKKKVIKTPSKPKLDRESGTPDKRTPPKVTRDEIKLKDPGVITPKVKKTTSDVGFDGKPVTPGNRGSSIPVTRDGKIKPGIQKDGKGGFEKKPVPKPVEKTVEKPVAKPVPVAAKPKITARSQMRQRNIDRFGSDKVNNLINKQKDFKSMQAKSMMPGAKPGAAKAEFAAKYKNSNVAKDLKKSKRVTQVMDLESYDAYDLVLIHLLETNQVESVEEANYVMTEMDGKTILEIKRLMESMPSHVRDSIGRQYGTGKYKGEKYTIEDKKNVVNWYSRIKA